MSQLSVGNIRGDKDCAFFNLDARITMGDLKVGEIFEYCQPWYDFVRATGLNVESINLKVLRINMYNKFDLQSLDCGMTCRVWFEGKESGTITSNSVIWTEDLNPPKHVGFTRK
jgi:hypothetical protein